MSLGLVVQILQIGFVGFAFLLALLAYRLLREQSGKERPSQAVLDGISRYMVFAIGLCLLAVVAQVVDAGVRGRTEGPGHPPVELSDLKRQVAQLASRLSGIRLVASDGGTSAGYDCGKTMKAEPTTLTVMYGLTDGTSCGVPNVNYYKTLTLHVPD